MRRFLGHSACFGETQTGKTWFMTRSAKAVAKIRGTTLIACSPIGIPSEWPKGTKFCTDVPGLNDLLADPQHHRGGVFVYVDEAAELRPDLERRGKYHFAQSLFRRGRHWGMTACLASQYPKEVWPGWRRNATRRHVFRLGDADQAKAVCQDAGMPKLPDGREPWRVIPTLPTLHCIQMIGGQTQAKLTRI